MGRVCSIRTWLLVTACLATCRPVGARPDQPARVAVLPVQTKDLSAEASRTYREIVEAVVGDVGVLALMDPKTVAARIDTLRKEEVYQPGCIEKMECIKRTGDRLQADLLVHLEADESVDGLRFTIRSFHTGTGSLLEKKAGFSGPSREEAGQVLRGLTLKSLAGVIKQRSQSTGKLVVTSHQEDAELLINGKSFGKMVGKRFTVAAGVHDVLVRREGFVPFHDVVLVEPGEVEEIEAHLQPERQPDDTPTGPVATGNQAEEPGAPGTTAAGAPYLPSGTQEIAKPAPEEQRTAFYETWWFWSLVGAGVAGAGGATAYFLLRDEPPSGQGRLEVIWE